MSFASSESVEALNREMKEAGLSERVMPVKLLNMVYDKDRNLSVYPPTYVHSCHLKIPSDIDKLPHLDDGYESHIKKEGKEVYKGDYDTALQAILSDAKICADFKSGKYDIVCHRGMLVRCAMNAYIEDNMSLLIIKYKGVLFYKELVYEVSDIRQHFIVKMDERDLHLTYWGNRFQKMVTSEKERAGPINLNEEYRSAFTAELGGHRLFYVAEMHCVDPETAEDVEIKTQRLFDPGSRYEASFCKFKATKWFLQTLFVGVHRIVVGMRSDDGVILRIEEMDSRDLPLKTREVLGSAAWKPDVCLKFLTDMFAEVRSAVIEESTAENFVVYKATWKKGETKFSVQVCKEEESFLPQWFLEKF